MQYIDKQSRDIDVVTSLEQKNHILSKYLLDKELNLRMDPFDQKVTLKKILEGGDKILVYLPPETDVFFPNNIQLFKILANYIHLDCDFIRQVDPTLVLLRVNKLEIAKRNRENERIPLETGIAFATNIISSKILIEANMFNIPNLVRVNFEDYNNRLSEKTNDRIRIDIFRSDLHSRFDVVKKSQKYLWISDTQNRNSYHSSSPEQVDYKEEVDDEISIMMKKYKEEKVLSEIILPILYTNHFEEVISLGYIQIQSKDKILSKETLEEYKKIRTEIASRIKESNIVKTTERFPILEASRHGLKMRVTNPLLIETLQKHDRFVFDIYFKMQAPFTVTGEIRWMSKHEDSQKLDLGILLMGKSALPGERERYYKNLDLAREGKLV
ncbi:MAG: DUF1577 domain-containing protein [Leptospiraceae bacterium]|nr:DUF1577 domain-containing protein [Leptospiraceae bacterium]